MTAFELFSAAIHEAMAHTAQSTPVVGVRRQHPVIVANGWC